MRPNRTEPKLGIGMVVRTLMTMGFEIALKPYDPRRPGQEEVPSRPRPPPLHRRELAQDVRRSANAERVIVDLE